ncbi:ABC-2 type transport system ATP-binding protein [Chitinophaga terrae (ex Kim and Jung 2007)]|uniref:ABC transporter ATP-binding protein n=1 Tax=Chitinophaga terrae (ex Kim and Jung 2007) TaxID=408074 RepID=UPI002782533F|nr:ABC transporter ATP-binding protein [Chitinophaga terrae (ex Kim and Jung 2007)]MDQ0105315.1 ABC-2 type transport system ATP-binding protein [Chitinophaga terrae (ex Kim and Jung 2007)]
MINIQSLTFSYRKNKPLFQNLNLRLEAGHVYGLLGKNGAGKSTLLKQIAGLIFPDQGSCEVNGHISAKRQPSFLQDIFLVPEEFYLPGIKVQTYVSIYAPFYPNFDHNTFFAYLKEFNIPDEQNLTEMSYGQKKKVLISFALATNTKVLIMDEPTNGLDIPSKSQFRKLIASALSDDKCIIISTHQVRDLDNLIDSIVIIDNHQIVFKEDVQTVTDKLSFKTVNRLEDIGTVLFADSSIKGHHVITPNNGYDHSKVDMELLFNAVLTNQKPIQEIFN